jgi:peptide deformylase
MNEEITKEQKEAVDSVMSNDKEEATDIEIPNEPVDYSKYYVAPHDKPGRDVTEEDIPYVLEQAEILHKLCFTSVGIYPGGYAVAHPQINDTDPLNFFVYYDGSIIINPVITNHTKTLVDSEEGCLSFPDKKMINVGRYNKIECDFQTIVGENKLSDIMHEKFNGKLSKIWQHEINHLLGKFIFNY